ncbi:TPA: hypothetical protein ACKPYB_000657 [Stenotrophomonas maltophilia]|uniref:hypothetical protein n=1 Tax=Stenotrophomonas maltophilia TaxID=40324 RepID=UPI0011B3D919|nr:hypothetical protein [Stenotrophomonas maltophilia]
MSERKAAFNGIDESEIRSISKSWRLEKKKERALKKRKTYNIEAVTLSRMSERAKQLRIPENALARLFFERGLSSTDDQTKKELTDLSKKIERDSIESQIKIYDAVQLMRRSHDESIAQMKEQMSHFIDAMSEILLASPQIQRPATPKHQAGRSLADQ